MLPRREMSPTIPRDDGRQGSTGRGWSLQHRSEVSRHHEAFRDLPRKPP
ncbi:hypothetical protein PspLS_02070 [Pyricularia sp. CBS 133598]|nr:hypothetical protein PspLS_02070 [Pyricularia sp. CBS 133598]